MTVRDIFVCDGKWPLLGINTGPRSGAKFREIFVYDLDTYNHVQHWKDPRCSDSNIIRFECDIKITQASDCSRTFYFDLGDGENFSVFQVDDRGLLFEKSSFEVFNHSGIVLATQWHAVVRMRDRRAPETYKILNAATGDCARTLVRVPSLIKDARPAKRNEIIANEIISNKRKELLVLDRRESTISAYCLEEPRM